MLPSVDSPPLTLTVVGTAAAPKSLCRMCENPQGALQKPVRTKLTHLFTKALLREAFLSSPVPWHLLRDLEELTSTSEWGKACASATMRAAGCSPLGQAPPAEGNHQETVQQ